MVNIPYQSHRLSSFIDQQSLNYAFETPAVLFALGFLTGGSRGTYLTARLQGAGGQRAGHTLRAGAPHTGLGQPQVSVEALGAALICRSLISGVAVSGVRVTAVSSAAAGLAGAEGSVCGGTAFEAGRAALAELALVAWWAAAGVHPASRDAAPPPCRHQLHIVKITTA